jgi:hypothetical protein
MRKSKLFGLTLLVCLLLGLFFSSPHSASAASSGTGHISGQLLNGSHNNAPVANQSVTLQMAQGNSTSDKITINTDAQGNYAFSALPSDSGIQYAVYTLYQGAQYVTDLIDLSKNADQQVNLTVYDATNTTNNVAVVQTTILLAKTNAQSGLLTISEDFFFENLGNSTYVGSLDSSKGKPNALIFSLPTGARFLTLGTGFDGYQSIQVDRGFASNAAVTPGTSRFSFSFQVPYTANSYQFSYQAVYPTVLLSLLAPLNVFVTPQGLTAKGQFNAQSGTYQKFDVQTLGPGKSVSAQFTGLQTPTQATSSQAPVNTSLLWLVALLILLIALAGIGGYLYNTRRHKAAKAKQQSLARAKKGSSTVGQKGVATARKASLLQELLELDKAHEAGKLKQAAYKEQRARIKARLRDLMHDQPEKSGNSEKQASVSSKASNGSQKGEK